MMHWLMKREKRGILLLVVPMIIFVFVLLSTTGLTQSSEQMEISADNKDYEEVFSAGDTNGIVYINWQESKATNEFSGPAWFLGAYRCVTVGESNGVSVYESLCVDLERRNNILTNNVYYAIHYSGGGSVSAVTNSAASGRDALFINLFDTNGVELAESGNLLVITNAIWQGGDITNSVLLVGVPTAEYPQAAVIQIRCGNAEAADEHSDDKTVIIQEGLLFIDDGADSWITDGQGNGTSGYSNGSGGNFSNYCEWVKDNIKGSSTNNPVPPQPSPQPPPDHHPKIIYVDQAIGNDTFTGGDAAVAAGNKGPKKTVGKGMGAVDKDQVPAMVIKSGKYGENLDIRGKNVRVVIEGNVKL